MGCTQSANPAPGEDLFRYERGALDYEDDLVDWLKALPKPVAILACNDIRGQQVVNACGEAGIRVPDEVAVLGVIRKIREKACEPGGVSVEQLCEDCGVSRSTLDKRFFSHLGRSVSDEIARHRLHHGRQLLLAGEMTLDEVATRSGFSSATYFCRFFKRETGETPDGFRRKHR